MNHFIITFEWNGQKKTMDIITRDIMDALEVWGKSHNHYYGLIIKIEKI